MKTFHLFRSLILVILLIGPRLRAENSTVTLETSDLSVTIARKGAELQSIKHLPTGIEYLWQGDPDYWTGRSPNMFPVNVRFKDNRFTYKNKPYEMPRMGLAVEADFEILTKTGDKKKEPKVTLVLNASENTLKYYPFPFQLKITSQIKGLKLIQTFRVNNTGPETLYFALGGHPGFNCPFIKGRDRSDYQYVFSESMQVGRNEISDSLLTGKRVEFLNKEERLTLADPRVPDGGMFLLDHDSRQIGVALKGRPPFVTLDLGDFPNTNLWSPPEMPYACIEPMIAHHDLAETAEAIEEKDYLISLPAGQSRTYQFAIIINPKEGVRALGR